MVQRPATLEALAEAAAIGEANAGTTSASAKTTDAAVSAQLAEMKAMMRMMQDVMTTRQRHHADITAIDGPPAFLERPQGTTTTATTTTRVHTSNAAATVTPTTTLSDLRSVTIQLVVPDRNTAQYNGGRDGTAGRPRRGRGRGWRGPWRGRLPSQHGDTLFQISATAQTFRPQNYTTSNGYAFAGNNSSPPCNRCGRRRATEGDCRANNCVCFECGALGHFARCCTFRMNPNPQH